MSEQITSYSALLGQIIGWFRQRQGFEQTQVAEALGVSQASYSRLEAGKATWSIDQLMVVCQTIGIPVEEVLEFLKHKKAQLEEAAHVEVIAAGRANSKGGEARKESSGGAFLAGAALGALLATLITKK